MTAINTQVNIVTGISTNFISSHKICACVCAGTMILEYYLTPTIGSTIYLYSGIIIIAYDIAIAKMCST